MVYIYKVAFYADFGDDVTKYSIGDPRFRIHVTS